MIYPFNFFVSQNVYVDISCISSIIVSIYQPARSWLVASCVGPVILNLLNDEWIMWSYDFADTAIYEFI